MDRRPLLKALGTGVAALAGSRLQVNRMHYENLFYNNLFDLLNETSFSLEQVETFNYSNKLKTKFTSNVTLEEAVPEKYISRMDSKFKESEVNIDLVSIVNDLEILYIPHFSFDKENTRVDINTMHIGQLVINKVLRSDLKEFFSKAYSYRFPISSIIPASNKSFIDEDGNWNDLLSMNMNNSYGFNPRFVANTKRISYHALGCAIDINPMQNPITYLNDNRKLPQASNYDTRQAGTLHNDKVGNKEGRLLTKILLDREWIWGANFPESNDYHHFHKVVRTVF